MLDLSFHRFSHLLIYLPISPVNITVTHLHFRCRSYVEYAAEQCQARVNSLVEALTEQGRTILTEVVTMMMTMLMTMTMKTKTMMMTMTMKDSLVEALTEQGRNILTELVFIIAIYTVYYTA